MRFMNNVQRWPVITILIALSIVSLAGTTNTSSDAPQRHAKKNISSSSSSNDGSHEELNLDVVSAWAKKIGQDLWTIGKQVTQLDAIKSRYKELNASVLPTDGRSILNSIGDKMNRMIATKVQALLSIKEAAESTSPSLVSNSSSRSGVDAGACYAYRSAKYSQLMSSEDFAFSTTYDDEGASGDDEGYKYDPNCYVNISLQSDGPKHFDGAFVNTNYSIVHVPTNIFDQSEKIRKAIQWSSLLDDTFRSNYRSDGRLIGQYFASTHGFQRYFPAFHWSIKPDTYDCRNGRWFIRAATQTPSKQAIILVDTSGSMYGMKTTIAELTTAALLETFDNNDLLNIYVQPQDDVQSLVDCFNGTLVQATVENLEIMKTELHDLCPNGKMDYKRAFEVAYRILHRFSKNDTVERPATTQAIFLLTDILPTELSDIRKIYETVYSDRASVVELFIYFIGVDIPNVREIQWDRCLRNGSLVHVRTMDEVRDDALKYLRILYKNHGADHHYYNSSHRNDQSTTTDRTSRHAVVAADISWTHISIDVPKDRLLKKNKAAVADEGEIIDQQQDRDDDGKTEPMIGAMSPRTIVSLSTPVYSKSASSATTSSSEPLSDDIDASADADLIGVAGIDVAVADFERLMLPYKIGVNGYAFLVSDNGYLISHPLLRVSSASSSQPVLRRNFDSVDLTEVEFVDDDNDIARQPDSHIVQLRQAMVDRQQGEMYEIATKFQYDAGMRVGSESKNYFYAPLLDTPYTLGLALPRGYGNYWIKTPHDEIEKSILNGEHFHAYFKGNWRIHAHWQYCDDYDQLLEHDQMTAEQKIVHFFERIFSVPNNASTTTNASWPQQCDKELLELLFFDAKLTQHTYEQPVLADDNIARKHEWDKQIVTRFVATQAGLTRWQDTSARLDRSRRFGDYANSASNETWYKSAVLLHQLNSDNFVFSLPSSVQVVNDYTTAAASDDALFGSVITASHAVFYHDGGGSDHATAAASDVTTNEAAGVVVGYQFEYRALYDKLIRIANNSQKTRCHLGALDCYIIDTNGYVVLSMQPSNVGKFFGEIEGAIMEQLLSENIFRRLTMFDYQAECKLQRRSMTPSQTPSHQRSHTAATVSSSYHHHPLTVIYSNGLLIVSWLLSRLSDLAAWNIFGAVAAAVRLPASNNSKVPDASSSNSSNSSSCKAEPVRYANKCQTRTIAQHIKRPNGQGKHKEPATDRQPCDTRTELYLFHNLSAYGYVWKQPKDDSTNCSRPFYIETIDYTNLFLVVVDPSHQTCFSKLRIRPVTVTYNYSTYPNSPVCNKTTNGHTRPTPVLLQPHRQFGLHGATILPRTICTEMNYTYNYDGRTQHCLIVVHFSINR